MKKNEKKLEELTNVQRELIKQVYIEDQMKMVERELSQNIDIHTKQRYDTCLRTKRIIVHGNADEFIRNVIEHIFVTRAYIKVRNNLSKKK